MRLGERDGACLAPVHQKLERGNGRFRRLLGLKPSRGANRIRPGKARAGDRYLIILLIRPSRSNV